MRYKGIIILFLWQASHGETSLLLFHHIHPHANTPNDKHQAISGDKIPFVPLPPNLPTRFYNKFILYYTSRDEPNIPLPPWPSVHPPMLPYVVGRGESWYAHDLGIMVESYADFCVPIFEPNSYFPCILFNYNGTAYFISDETTGYGPCCVYRKPWAPPHRDFMQQFTRYFNRSTKHFGPGLLKQGIDWWVVPLFDTRLSIINGGAQKHPVFGGYGWSQDIMASGYRAQVCFWYEGNIGWTQQLFYDFVDHGPRIRDLESFRLPDICRTDRTCLYRP